MIIGGFLATYMFMGLIMLSGFIALVESIRPLKWFVERTSKFIDVVIFLGTIWATAQLGVTITASLTFAGLGFTLVYAPYLRLKHENHKNKINPYKSK